MMECLLGVSALKLCGAIVIAGPTPHSVSGVLATFVKIEAVTEKEKLDLYLPYMSIKQIIPSPNSKCNIAYVEDDLKGIVGLEAVEINKARIIENISCD